MDMSVKPACGNRVATIGNRINNIAHIPAANVAYLAVAPCWQHVFSYQTFDGSTALVF